MPGPVAAGFRSESPMAQPGRAAPDRMRVNLVSRYKYTNRLLPGSSLPGW